MWYRNQFWNIQKLAHQDIVTRYWCDYQLKLIDQFGKITYIWLRFLGHSVYRISNTSSSYYEIRWISLWCYSKGLWLKSFKKKMRRYRKQYHHYLDLGPIDYSRRFYTWFRYDVQRHLDFRLPLQLSGYVHSVNEISHYGLKFVFVFLHSTLS